jgi:hypothetical protein
MRTATGGAMGIRRPSSRRIEDANQEHRVSRREATIVELSGCLGLVRCGANSSVGLGLLQQGSACASPRLGTPFCVRRPNLVGHPGWTSRFRPRSGYKGRSRCGTIRGGSQEGLGNLPLRRRFWLITYCANGILDRIWAPRDACFGWLEAVRARVPLGPSFL